jgi:hypothetical protein
MDVQFERIEIEQGTVYKSTPAKDEFSFHTPVFAPELIVFSRN